MHIHIRIYSFLNLFVYSFVVRGGDLDLLLLDLKVSKSSVILARTPPRNREDLRKPAQPLLYWVAARELHLNVINNLVPELWQLSSSPLTAPQFMEDRLISVYLLLHPRQLE